MTTVCPDCLAEVDAAQESCAACGFVRPAGGWLADPLTGLILGGRYRLEGRLGTGGMAAVFRASRIGALGGHVAVKVLAPRFSRTVIARRFEREAQVVARLTNPYVVRIYDFDSFAFANGPTQQSLYYIAMELIEGQTLSQLLRAQGKVNFLWGIDVLRQLARGLEEAHAQGIVHRDLKPSNIVLMRQRGSTHVKILDFGIAALTVRDEAGAESGASGSGGMGSGGIGSEKLTQTGFVSGTPDYMSPEQAVGDPSVGPAADMFSIGVIAFEMLSGRKPFEGATMESLLARVTKPAPSLRVFQADPSFPPELFRIVDKLLERDHKVRYQHAGELLDDLGRFPTLQTTPDFVPPAELIEKYATSASQAALQIPEVLEAQRSSTLVGREPVVAPGASKLVPTLEVARARKSGSAWVWIVALLVLGGIATGLVLVLMNPGRAPVGSDASVATSAPPLAPVMEGDRPALEAGFVDAKIPLGGVLVSVATPVTSGPLYRPVPLRVALDREGKPLRLASGSMTVTRARDAADVAAAAGSVRDDGRLALELPPRPSPERYAVKLALVIAGGETVETRLVYDATTGTFTAP